MAMTEVKNPILLDSSMNDEAMLHPAKGSLKLQMEGVSEASLTLEDKAEDLPMHRWVKIYNARGFVGYFRRTSRGRNIGTDNGYTLRYGIDILQDSVWDAEETFEGTKAQFLTAILNKQTQLINGVKPWVLGSCADTSSVKKDIKYDNLMDLFESAVEEGGGYYFTYNQNVWPWQVSLVEKPSDVASEFRLDRNMEKCSIKDNDSELCTRLILNVNKMVKDDAKSKPNVEVKQNQSVIRIYNNTAAQSVYGIIVKTADIDVENDTFPSGPFPEADAWAADFMERRAEPLLQVEIDGTVLKGLTGDDWDESRIGTKARAALPDYATAITERCVTITYPDMYGDPDRITVSLANALPTFTKSMKSTQKNVSKQARSGRSSAREAKSFDQHFKITDDNGNILQQAGMHLDANGLLVYADDNVNMVGARFNVQADKIGMVVGTNQDGNFIKAGEIALAINATTGESTAWINASHVNISATNTAYALAGDMEHDANGKLIIKSAGGMYVRRTKSGVTSEFGVFDDDTLTAGVIATKVNGETSTMIKGTKISIGNNETVGTWISGKVYLDDVTATYIGSKISDITTLTTQSIAASGTISANRINGGSIYFRNSAGAGYTYTDIKGAAMSSVSLIDNGNDTYTLKSYKIDGTETVVGTFNRGGGEADRIAGWNDYWNTGWKVPTDSDSGGKFMVPSTKSSDGSWSYQEWSRAFNSVVWSIEQSPYVQSSRPSGYTNLGTVGVSSSCYIYFKIKANGATKNYYIYARV